MNLKTSNKYKLISWSCPPSGELPHSRSQFMKFSIGVQSFNLWSPQFWQLCVTADWMNNTPSCKYLYENLRSKVYPDRKRNNMDIWFAAFHSRSKKKVLGLSKSLMLETWALLRVHSWRIEFGAFCFPSNKFHTPMSFLEINFHSESLGPSQALYLQTKGLHLGLADVPP